MSLRLKGEAGEELFATFFVVALVFIFVFSANGVYGNFMAGQAQLYAERSASSVAETLFFNNSGMLSLSACQSVSAAYALNNVALKITYWKNDVEYACETRPLETRSLSVASMPIFVTENGALYPGRLDAMVGV